MMQGRTAGTWSPVAKALPMSKPIIRYLRFHCPSSTAIPQPNRDGALAVRIPVNINTEFATLNSGIGHGFS